MATTSNIQEPIVGLNAFTSMSGGQVSDVLITLVGPILLLSALVLTAYFAYEPLSFAIPLMSNFSLSLPLMICTGSCLVLAIALTVQVVRRKNTIFALKKLWGQAIHSTSLGSVIREHLHCNGRKETKEAFRQSHAGSIARTTKNTMPVSYTTRDGVELTGYWSCTDEEQPTLIIFHGNGMTADQFFFVEEHANNGWRYWGEWCVENGYNFFLAEYRGYGLSDGEAAGNNQEMEAYYDAEAALRFVLEKGIEKNRIVSVGYSLGGAYATFLGSHFGIEKVILQNTFTSFSDVMHNCVKWISPAFSEEAVRAAYKSDVAKPLIDSNGKPTIPGAKPFETDGFDNKRKVGLMDGKLLVIRAEEDTIMHRRFAKQLLKARYPLDQKVEESATQEAKKERKECLITVGGEHWAGALLFSIYNGNLCYPEELNAVKAFIESG
jgi:pimeloyl-ACP methyl ester carboxylesterase